MNHSLLASVASLLLAAILLPTTLPAQTQSEMNAEAAEEYKKADTELNKLYPEVLKKLTPKQQEMVRKTQKAWLAYRNLAREEAGMMYEGGSIRPLIEYTVLRDLTIARTETLKDLITP